MGARYPWFLSGIFVCKISIKYGIILIIKIFINYAMKTTKQENKKIAVYKDKKNNIQIKVDIDKETVWLTQKEMGMLFDKDIKTINRHIINIYKEEELDKKSTISEKEIVQREKDRLVQRNLNYYNLDVIISVGYRVNSKAGTAFRIWATNTLRKYLLKGFVLNEHRMLEQQKKEVLKLQNTIAIIYNKIKTPLLVGQEQELIGIIQRYTKSLSILRQYDRGLLKNIANVKSKFILEYDNCLMVIDQLAKELEVRKELTELFGRQNNNEKLKSVIGTLIPDIW